MKNFLLILLLVGLGTGMALADGTQPPGDGSSGNPYQVSELNHLLWISANDSSWGSHFQQTADIDASDISNFSPIGNNSIKFTGTYDGQGHTISNLTIKRSLTWFIGLFGYTDSATIANLGLINVNITGYDCVGGLVGYNNFSSTVSNCYSTGSVSGENNVGGLVGRNMSGSTVSNCYSTASVSGTGSWAGGLVGYNSWQPTATVSNCYSTGNVSGNQYVGGLVGGNVGTLSNSFWDTETSGRGWSAGGTGKTTAEMKSLATFTDAGWDFEVETINGTNDYWDMDLSGNINNGYPYLSWQDGEDVKKPPTTTDFSDAVPSQSMLLPNYPNPFKLNPFNPTPWIPYHPKTWIPYLLATDAKVIIRIYNTKGQLIHTIDLGYKKAGTYMLKDKAAIWDGRNDTGVRVGSGIYFYTLQAGDFRATRRMVIY